MRSIKQIRKELADEFGSAWHYYPDKALEVGSVLEVSIDLAKADAAVSQQKLVGCEQVGPPVFDSQRNWYTVRMRKSPQER